jgi:two-component system CheB/CheR fusion protein
LKYNSNPHPKVSVTFFTDDNHAIIKISDNGIGVPPQHREKIFEIFKRLHSKEQYSGSGIGLAICKKIVEQLKGKIWVEENTGGGSVFVISLPDSILVS